MFTRLRRRLSYANVVATLALFLALGGSSYAVSQISGSQLRNNSVSGKKLKRNTIGGTRIKESRLGTVPRARNAARLGGLTAQRLLLKCPDGTIPAADVCVETQARAPLNYDSAVGACGSTDSTRTPGRRLPTHGELRRAFDFDQMGPIAPEGELTSEVYPSGSSPGQVEVLFMTDELGHVGVVQDRDDGAKAFRCVADPLN
ncbi:MAG: hypothetical protein H0T69_06540 [Thermoleophilaceae bacterium]|nr:hypothetical protein [Thermoleophilaceae bacterium]